MTPRPMLDAPAAALPTAGWVWVATCAASELYNLVLGEMARGVGRLDDASEEATSVITVLCNATEDAYDEETRHLSRLGDGEGA